MIVNNISGGWEIIFQRHHALLAAKIAAGLREKFHTPYWLETLIAIAEHDDGQRDWNEGRFINEKGHPVDFTEYEYDLQHAHQAVTEASYKSKWEMLLVSKHITEIYRNASYLSYELSQYLEEQKVKNKKLLKYFKISHHQLEDYYRLLRWADECSLALCRGSKEKDLGQLSDHQESYTLIKSKESFKIDPWPFKDDQLTLELETYPTVRMTFTDNSDLFHHLKAKGPTLKKVRLTPAS